MNIVVSYDLIAYNTSGATIIPVINLYVQLTILIYIMLKEFIQELGNTKT